MLNSSYDLIDKANRLITGSQTRFYEKVEREIIVLLNAVSSYPRKSNYQLSLSRKAFGDIYFMKGILQNALDQYVMGLDINKWLPVKRRIKALKSIEPWKRTSSLDSNMVDLKYLYKPNNVTYIYDEEFETEIEKMLSFSDDLSVKEFYRTRPQRNGDGILSPQDQDMLTLKAMQKTNVINFRTDRKK